MAISDNVWPPATPDEWILIHTLSPNSPTSHTDDISGSKYNVSAPSIFGIFVFLFFFLPAYLIINIIIIFLNGMLTLKGSLLLQVFRFINRHLHVKIVLLGVLE
jgi:hypothetical protein